MILKNMYEKLKEFKDVKVQKLIIGLGYTIAVTEIGLGFSYTLITRKDSCTVNHNAGKISGQKIGNALEVLSDYQSNIISRTVLIALHNAVIDFDKISNAGKDAIELMNINPNDSVYMVGYFEPLVPVIKAKCPKFKIIEERMGSTTGSIPDDEWDSTVNIITSTSLINGSFDDISHKCRKARVNCLIGPSTPLAPEIFKNKNIHFLAGLKPLDHEKIIEAVSEGGGTKIFNKHCEKYTVKI